eukprot:4168950-Pyramimonas_sp.AAC.1
MKGLRVGDRVKVRGPGERPDDPQRPERMAAGSTDKERQSFGVDICGRLAFPGRVAEVLLSGE